MSKINLLIGLSGKMGSGKDSVYDVACNCIHVPVWRLAFGDGVRREVAKATNVGLRYLKANKELFRPILQWWGTEFRRNLTCQDYWVKKVRAKLEHDRRDGITFVTDVRFPNEAEMIRELGGIVVRVVRPDLEQRNGSDHCSESELDHYDFDAVIENDGALETLIPKIKDLINDRRV